MYPKLFEVSGFILYAYPLFIGLSWGLSFRLGESRYPEMLGHKRYLAWFVGVFIFSWVGAKLLFVLTQDQWQSTELMMNSNFWMGGGFVYLGGLLGGAIFSLLFLLTQKLSIKTFEFSLVPLLLGHSLGRVGCFLAGCCYGTPTEYPWSVHLHQANRHPVQLYEALLLLMLAWFLEKKSQAKLIHYLAGYGILRFFLEYFRGDEIRGEYSHVTTSQWISLGMIGLALALKIQSQVTKNTTK